MSESTREQWQSIRDEHQSVHRGLGMKLSDEDHEAIHNPSRPAHERATRLMQHIARSHPNDGSGLGVHWTTDSNVAHHFAKNEAKYLPKREVHADGERYGHNSDGFSRQRPETRVVLHAHFPEHEHIAHEEEDQDGAYGWDERNTAQFEQPHGHGVAFEREVPIKRGQPVKVHAISWGLASHSTDDEAPHDNETTRYDFPETQHHQASFHRWLPDGRDALAAREPGSRECPDCKGVGYVGDEGCERCDESGYLTPHEAAREPLAGEGITELHPSRFSELSMGDHPGKNLAQVREKLQADSPDYYGQLRDDISRNGVEAPVLLRGRKVMDGHNRLAIADELGQSVPVGDYDREEHYDAGQHRGMEWYRKRNELGARRASVPTQRIFGPAHDGRDALAPRQAVTEHWPPYLTERHDPEYGDVPVNTSRHNVRGPVGTEEQAHAAGWVGPYFHGTSSRRAADIRRGGFRQPRVHNQDMRLPGDSEEVDFGHTHRTYFASTHDDAMSFARAHHGDDAAVVTAYLHPDHIETESGGGFMASTQVRDAAKAMAIRPDAKQAAFTPTKRIFGPTHGLDHRLWDGDHLKHDVSAWVMDTLDGFWRPVYGPGWRTWSRVYFAGSEASEWTSQDREGNNDFDCLIGLDFTRIREDLGGLFTMMTDEQVVNGFNKQLTTLLWPRTDAAMIPVDGHQEGPFSATFFCNAKAWDIREIKPYAAYCISTDKWAVRPPHLPDWSIKDFPAAFVKEARAVEAYVRAVLALPEPMRAQQADALWRHLHGDRSRAFSAQGEGWFDPGNALEKYLDQAKGVRGKSLWETLADAHFEAQAHPDELLAPSDWSNTPPVYS